jgi:hypothetical protein
MELRVYLNNEVWVDYFESNQELFCACRTMDNYGICWEFV